MEKEIWVARSEKGTRLFAFSGKPAWDFDQERWKSLGHKWLELPSTWCESVTFENSPRRVRSLCLHRKQ